MAEAAACAGEDGYRTEPAQGQGEDRGSGTGAGGSGAPADPKGASTSGKAEQKRGRWQLSGEAKHSKPTPSLSRSTRHTGGPSAA